MPDNLSTNERKALKSLKHDKTIVIRQADKGSCVVVMSIEQYLREGLAHLSDPLVYEKLPQGEYTKALGINLNRTFKNWLENKTISHLLYKKLRRNPDDLRCQRLYFLYKAHKVPPAVRPIVSATKDPTETASRALDDALKQILPELPYLLTDTLDAINQIEHMQFPKDCLLATIDVKSLYTNIPQQEGTDRVLQYYYGTPLPNHMPESVARHLLRVVLGHNHFEFNGEVYRQISGVAMGTKCAPTFANIFMASIEEEFLSLRQTRDEVRPLLWLRFIDDILVVWPEGGSGFPEFLDQLNAFDPNLKYTYEESDTDINFLDLTIYKGTRFSERQVLDLRPHFKKTNKFQYLHFRSCHPGHTYRGLVRGETIRMLRASSDPSTYVKSLGKIGRVLLARGYPKHRLESTFYGLPFGRRSELLVSKDIKAAFPGPGCAALRVPYDPAKPPNIIKKLLPQVTPNQPIKSLLVFEGSKHTANSIVRSKIKGAPVSKTSTNVTPLPTTDPI